MTKCLLVGCPFDAKDGSEYCLSHVASVGRDAAPYHQSVLYWNGLRLRIVPALGNLIDGTNVGPEVTVGGLCAYFEEAFQKPGRREKADA